MDRAEDNDKAGVRKGLGKLEGLLSGLNELANRLNQASEQIQEKTKSGSFGLQEGEGGDKPRGVFGFSVKLGLGGEEPKIEPFGNVRRNPAGEPVVEDVREPLLDVFDEDDRLLLVAEMPGIEAPDVKLELHDHSLDLRAEHGRSKYRKQIEVPAGIERESMKVSAHNGIVEIECPKRH